MAKRGNLDCMFFQDSAAISVSAAAYGAKPFRMKSGRQAHIEAIGTIASLGAITSRTGLGSTCTPSYNEPYNVARRFRDRCPYVMPRYPFLCAIGKRHYATSHLDMNQEPTVQLDCGVAPARVFDLISLSTGSGSPLNDGAIGTYSATIQDRAATRRNECADPEYANE